MAGTATELERLVVRLVGEGSGYDKVLKDAVVKTEKAAKSIGALTEKEMAAHNRAMQEAARITEAVATPTQRYAKELETLEHLYKEGHISQETYNRALKQTTAALPSVQKAQAAHNEELRKAKAITDNARTPTEQYRQKLAEVERLYRKGLLSGTTYHRTLQSLNKEFTKGSFAVGAFGKKLTSAGRSMRMFGMMATAAVTLPVVGMIAAYGKFDSEMTKSTAIMGHMTAGLRKGMEETAESISRNSVTAATELAKAYFYLASAGMDAQQSIAALPVVEKFAVAGAFDMAQATDLLTDAQSALGLSSKDAQQNMAGMLKVSDALVKANTLANATVEQFSSALTNEAGAAIKQFNLGLEEGVAILATYADQGLKANSAGSMFARMIRLLVKSIKDNQEVFDRLNINTEEFATTGKNVTEVIRGITEATAGMGPVQKAATLEMLGFEARIQQAILPLLGLTDKIRGYEQELMKAGGITQDVADKQLASFSSQMKILWNQIKGVGREIGSYLAPHVKTLGK
ncbi:phage tail tape measure protein, partial [Patescibacteria group bacterium]|nr:phage tail tape measure protein [Patescibacteria group bacterium]